MKVASNIIFLFKDADGFGTAISDALQPNPNSSFRRLEESFELSLQERYGIKDCKASGDIVHFVDGNGLYQVSVLLLQNYEPPILVCAVNEVLASIMEENLSTMPTVVLPFMVATSKLKWDGKNSSMNNKVSLYGMQIGQATDISQAMSGRTQKPPSQLQIHHEPLTCCRQLIRVLNLPAFFLIGQSGLSNKVLGEELEVIYEIGKLLADFFCLSFLRERIAWNPTKASRESEEPWRALYG